MASSISDTDRQYKIRENRARRAAARQELHLSKSRTRDWRSPEYCVYWLTDSSGCFVVPRSYRWSLDEIERWLALPPER